MSFAWLFWGLVFSSIGMGYFVYGKKQARIAAIGSGLALMIYPYFVGNLWLMFGVGLALMAVPYFVRS